LRSIIGKHVSTCTFGANFVGVTINAISNAGEACSSSIRWTILEISSTTGAAGNLVIGLFKEIEGIGASFTYDCIRTYFATG
jgi:hypothetical protein